MSEKPRFTPGPWVADALCMEDARCVRVGTTNGTPLYYHRTATICEAYVSHRALGDALVPGEPDIGIITAEANARLIAAAPDLYDFIATLENDDGKIPDWLWQKRSELLARARGESS